MPAVLPRDPLRAVDPSGVLLPAVRLTLGSRSCLLPRGYFVSLLVCYVLYMFFKTSCLRAEKRAQEFLLFAGDEVCGGAPCKSQFPANN
jgi:hypothetical protein